MGKPRGKLSKVASAFEIKKSCTDLSMFMWTVKARSNHWKHNLDHFKHRRYDFCKNSQLVSRVVKRLCKTSPILPAIFATTGFFSLFIPIAACMASSSAGSSLSGTKIRSSNCRNVNRCNKFCYMQERRDRKYSGIAVKQCIQSQKEIDRHVSERVGVDTVHPCNEYAGAEKWMNP